MNYTDFYLFLNVGLLGDDFDIYWENDSFKSFEGVKRSSTGCGFHWLLVTYVS